MIMMRKIQPIRVTRGTQNADTIPLARKYSSGGQPGYEWSVTTSERTRRQWSMPTRLRPQVQVFLNWLFRRENDPPTHAYPFTLSRVIQLVDCIGGRIKNFYAISSLLSRPLANQAIDSGALQLKVNLNSKTAHLPL